MNHQELSRSTHLMKQFGWLYTVFTRIPEWIVGLLHPLSKQLFRLRRDISLSIESARQHEPHNDLARTSLTPVFGSLLQSSKPALPESELSNARLTDEGLTLLGAGTVTSAQTLSTTVFYILSKPTILSKLRAELTMAFWESTNPTWSSLSQLPYLTAIITEGLRLSYGVSSRLPRISPDDALNVGPYVIPPGTPVSMTQMLLHDDPNLFPRPSEFLPGRWLNSVDSTPSSKRYFVPFSKGTRACLAINLAWAELYLCLASLFKPVEFGGLDLKLHETGSADVKVQHDYFNPAPARSSLGVRVLVT
jgi:cytochrome P450